MKFFSERASPFSGRWKFCVVSMMFLMSLSQYKYCSRLLLISCSEVSNWMDSSWSYSFTVRNTSSMWISSRLVSMTTTSVADT